jgi:hypothetical protein
MDTVTSKILPPLPLLIGKENFDEWNNLLIQTFRFHDMADYLVGAKGLEPAVQTEQKQALSVILITSSMSSAMIKLLVHAGWKLGKPDQDPKELYDLIVKMCQQGSTKEADSSIMDKWLALNVKDCKSVSEFQARVFDLKVQSEQVGWGFNSGGCEREKALLLHALREYADSDWYRDLFQVSSKMKWYRLMQKVTKESQRIRGWSYMPREDAYPPREDEQDQQTYDG